MATISWSPACSAAEEPAVANGAQGMSANNIGRSAYDFLTYEDRALLSDMYAYAQDED